MNFQTSNWKQEIMKHPAYTRHSRLSLQVHTDLEKDELIRMLKQMIEYHDTYAADKSSFYAAAARSNGRVFMTDGCVYFSDEACDELRKLIDIVEKSDDDRFNMTYIKTRDNVMLQLEKPVITVVDVYEECAAKTIEYENHKIVFKDGDAVTLYQLYDIADELSVGEPFTDSFITTDDIKPAARAKAEFEQQVGIRSTLDDIKVTMVSPEACTNEFRLALADILKQSTLRTCKICGNDFIISNSEKQWFKDRNMNIPKTCSRCRYKRRLERRTQEWNQLIHGESDE